MQFILNREKHYDNILYQDWVSLLRLSTEKEQNQTFTEKIRVQFPTSQAGNLATTPTRR